MARHLNKQLIARSFGKAATHYDDVATLQQRTADTLLTRLSALTLKPETILDLGAGTGRNIALLARMFTHAKLFAIDIAPEMVQKAKQRYADDNNQSHHRTANYVVGDAETLPFANNSIDLIFANLILQWCDTMAIFNEINRVLRPGGLLVFASLAPHTLCELRQCWQTVDDYTHINTFDDTNKISTAIASSGLDVPLINTDTLTLLYNSSVALMKDIKTLGASNVNTGRRPGLTSKHALAKVAKAYEKFRIKELLPATYQVIYGVVWSISKPK